MLTRGDLGPGYLLFCKKTSAERNFLTREGKKERGAADKEKKRRLTRGEKRTAEGEEGVDAKGGEKNAKGRSRRESVSLEEDCSGGEEIVGGGGGRVSLAKGGEVKRYGVFRGTGLSARIRGYPGRNAINHAAMRLISERRSKGMGESGGR